jgi:hypothetical protein
LFRTELVNLIDQRHELVRLAGLIDWQALADEWRAQFVCTTGRRTVYPTDSRLLNRAREQLVDAAQGVGIALRQSYARVGKAAEHQAGRYAHAKQYRRMQREVRKLRT